MIVSVALVKIPVTDFPRACAFYREVVGLEEEFAVEEYGWAQYATGGVPLCLYVTGRGGGDGQPGGETGIHLAFPDLTAAHAALQQRGARFAGDLVSSDDGGSFVLLQDPDGNVIKLVQAY